MTSYRVLAPLLVGAGMILWCTSVVATRPQGLGFPHESAFNMRSLLATAPEATTEAPPTSFGGISRVGMAFLLVCIAGLCAPLGACVVLFINTDKHVAMLPGGLALAAGVMILVSIYEVLHESFAHFEAVIKNGALVQLCTMVSFFMGVPVCSVLDWITDKALNLLVRKERENDMARALNRIPSSAPNRAASKDVTTPDLKSDLSAGKPHSTVSNVSDVSLPAVINNMPIEASCPTVSKAVDCLAECTTSQYRALIRTSILVTLALELHNIPEGLATFVGYMSAPSTGVLIAVAIAMHNIPEGICVAIPVYFATGQKWKGILWAAIAGITEPIGALLGYAVFQSGHMDDIAMGIIMGLVAGIMTAVSFHELLPRALSYDKGGRVVYRGVIAGMAFMSMSLVLLALWE